MEQVDGQLDVFEVLDLIEKEGIVGKPKFQTKVRRMKNTAYAVTIIDHDVLHTQEFWSQAECDAFIKGWQMSVLMRA